MKNTHTSVYAADATWNLTLISPTCKISPVFSPFTVPHYHYFFFPLPISNWGQVAKHAVPVPNEWLPVEEPSLISFDNVGSILAGQSYDNGENKDPYPEFCWMSKRLRKGVVDVSAIDVDAEMLNEQHDMCEEKADVQTKRHTRLFKRFMMKLKTFTFRKRRLVPVSHQDNSFYSLPPTPILSSYASSFTHP